MKKRSFLPLFLIVLLLLSSCGSQSPQVQTMKGWSFQYNSGTDDYSLFFALCDKEERAVSAAADVSIRIVNDRGEQVYTGTKSITEENYGTYTSQSKGDRFLADVKIAASEINAGSSKTGTVYFTVNGAAFSFDEAQCEAYSCLPIKDVALEHPALPAEVQNRSSYFGLQSTVSITDISFVFDKESYSPSLKISIVGEVLYANKSYGLGFFIVDYKLFDHEGYVIKTGSVYLDSALDVGDKFKDDLPVIYDAIPGEVYSLQFFDHETA